jgi:peptidoglycan/LPS O-acetylase OafA/YrhL
MELFKIQLHPGRTYGLDILRAIAILLVLYSHCIPFLSSFVSAKILNIPIIDGVSIFFVLSGYLIGGIMIKTIERDGVSATGLLNFLSRRWLRTIPLYYFVLTLLIGLTMMSKDISYIKFSSFYFFIQNFDTSPPGFFTEAWSLSVEEWFYLSMPFLIFSLIGIGKMNPKRAVLLAAVLLIIAITAIRIFKFHDMNQENLKHYFLSFSFQVITRVDSIMYGVLGAYLSFYHNDWWKKNKITGLCIGIGILLFYKLIFVVSPVSGKDITILKWYMVSNYTAISIAVLCLMPMFDSIKTGSGNVYKFFTFISLISYSLYLTNLSLVYDIFLPVTLKYLPDLSEVSLNLVSLTLYLTYTLVLSVLLYKLIEVPFMNLRDKISFIKNKK